MTLQTETYNLQAINPFLAKEWHPTKNGILTSKDVTPKSSRKVWWLCKKGHEWQAGVYTRSDGHGCPYCNNKLPSKDNCLETFSLRLSKEWHPIKNGSLKPKDVTPKSGRKVWWLCKKRHEWQAVISGRANGSGCPYCAGKLAHRDNCLRSFSKTLSKEWHPIKNGSLKPKDVTPKSGRKVWWLCKKRHEWQAVIASRADGRGCPFCSGKAVCKDNSLQTTRPELSREWHPTKNIKLTPADVTIGSNVKVWWRCRSGHEWQVKVNDRVNSKGCPSCNGYLVTKTNSLQAVNPLLAKQWHPTKNRRLTPRDVKAGSNKSVWWLCKNGHEWQAVINSRSQGRGCPFCYSQSSLVELRIFTEIKHLFSNAKHRIKLDGLECDVFIPCLDFGIEIDGVFWHKDRYINDKKKTELFRNKGVILLHLREKGLMKVSKEDIIFSEKDSPFILLEKILKVILEKAKLDRNQKQRINMYLADRIIANEKEYNKLLNTLPSPLPGTSLYDNNIKLSKEWHPRKNRNLTPKDVYLKSGRKVWWRCKKGHEWQAVIASRADGRKCPYCSGTSFVSKENCLLVTNPSLAKEWHPTKNFNLRPEDVRAGSHKKVWWLCKKGHEWQAEIKSRDAGRGCPYCKGKLAYKDYCLHSFNPSLSRQWHPTKNGKLTPKDVTPKSNKKVWWLCSKGHEWQATIVSRSEGRGCWICFLKKRKKLFGK